MKKGIYLLIILSILLFISCESYQNEMATVVESYRNNNVTCTFDSTIVPRHSFVKATIIPETGYDIDSIKISGETKTKYYKSDEEENVYFILLNGIYNVLEIKTSEKRRHSITEFAINHCSIELNKNNTYCGDKVTCTITPDSGYYIDSTCYSIICHLSSENVLITPDESNPNVFSFLMPDTDVNIFVTAKAALASMNNHYAYKLGDNVTLNFTNRKPEDTYDIKLDNNYKNSNNSIITIASNITISNSYTVPSLYFTDETKTGNYTLKIYCHNTSALMQTIDIDINLTNTPEGWTTIGFIRDSSNTSFNGYYFTTKQINKVKYKLTKNNSSDIYEGETNCSFWYSDYSIYFYNTQLNSIINSYDKFYIWVEDEDKKLISRKISFDL